MKNNNNHPEQVKRDWIDTVICNIMHFDGPDRHVDGHEEITDFIMALLEGKDREWAETYKNKVGIRYEYE